MFREVSMVEVREVLRLWLAGRGQRAIVERLAIDRKTVRRYLEAATRAGLQRSQGEEQLTEALVGAVLTGLRPGRRSGTGYSAAWLRLREQRAFVEEKLKEGLHLIKIASLLQRQGVSLPYRTLHRFATVELGFEGRQRRTVRVADGKPGSECQVDFGRMGLLWDSVSGRRRLVYGMVFTACYSRHHFCWLCFRQTLAEVIEGFEQAWRFFGGVFEVVIPDNLKPVVVHADPIAPRFNPVFLEYAQSRGFWLDPARVRRPTDKPRVERTVPYCRNSGFRGEQFRDLTHAREWMANWCRSEAGLRIHGTTQRRPLEQFEQEEQPLLRSLPATPYVLPLYAEPMVHRDHHSEVGRALYSVPGNRIGERVQVRVDSHLVKIFSRGQLIKVHPRQPPGGRSTDPEDLPQEKRGYAMRDLVYLQKLATGHGPAIGHYAACLLDTPLPWTRMRQVYRLLGLARRYGDARVDQACARALALEVIDVVRIARMLERGLEGQAAFANPTVASASPGRPRFARGAEEFARPGSLIEAGHD
jgi:transposase